MSGGRASDDAVIWYCHKRLMQLLSEGAEQKKLAKLGGIPASAVSHLRRHAKGVGPATATGFAKIFGFSTRGQLVDAADRWWATDEARAYAKREWNRMARERDFSKRSDGADEAALEKTAD